MQFLYPSFLWALLALAIPIIIHLFYFRRFKRILFTNVKYLKEIKEETSNRNKLKNLLVLLARCLAITGLVFAFAQPFIPTGDKIKSGINNISVFIDNSYSMTAAKQDIPLLDYAKERAAAIVNAYDAADRFQILTNDFEGKHQRLVSKEDALSYIQDVKLSPSVKTLEQIINRQKQLFESEPDNKISYIISDFQKSISNISTDIDTSLEINLLPIQTSQQKNLSIDSVWFDGPIPVLHQNNNLILRIKNNSGENAEQLKLSFKKDGQEKPIGIRDIPANSTITDTVSVNVEKSGWQQAIVALSDYPIQFDDEYFISFFIPDTIHALFINESGPNKFMDALFKGIKYFSLENQNVNQLQYQQFSNFDLIILNDLNNITSGLASELGQYIRNGGKVLVFPGKNTELTSYNLFFTSLKVHNILNINKNKREVSSINTEEFVFSDVFIHQNRSLKLPVTTLSYDFAPTGSVLMEKVLTYRDGASFMAKYRVGDGQLFICSSPLDKEVNDLVINAEIFVPLVYKLAISSTNQKKLAYTISNNILIETDNKRKAGDYVYKVSNGKEEFIPGQSPSGNKIFLDLDDQIRTSGFYNLLLDDEVVGVTAFNYDRKESDMSMYSETELENLQPQNNKIKVISSALQADISSTISEKDKGIVLWKWFVILALLFLVCESLLLRYLKS